MRRNILGVLGKSVVWLLAGVLAGVAFLVLAYRLPVNMEKRDILYGQLDGEGWYPRATFSTASFEAYFHSFFPDVLDGHSDKIILYTALDTGSGNPLFRAMNSHSEYTGDYSYYWHGYVTVLRPLLLFFDLAELRNLNGLGQLFILFLLAMRLYRERGRGYVFMLFTSYVLLMPLALSVSLQFSWVFYISYIGTLILLRWRGCFEEKSRYVYFFIVIGMMTSYGDLLTYPLATWGIPLTWWIVAEDRQRTAYGWLRRVVCSGLAWIFGYGAFWSMKWVLATAILGRDVWSEAVSEVFFRSGVAAENVNRMADRWYAIDINWKHYGYAVYMFLLAA